MPRSCGFSGMRRNAWPGIPSGESFPMMRITLSFLTLASLQIFSGAFRPRVREFHNLPLGIAKSFLECIHVHVHVCACAPVPACVCAAL